MRQGRDPAQCVVKIGQQNFHGAERGIVESVLRAENHVQAVVMPALVADAVQKRGVHALQGPAKRTLQGLPVRSMQIRPCRESRSPRMWQPASCPAQPSDYRAPAAAVKDPPVPNRLS